MALDRNGTRVYDITMLLVAPGFFLLWNHWQRTASIANYSL